MADSRLTLAHSWPAVGACLLLACGSAHRLGDGGTDAGFDSDAGSLDGGSPRDAAVGPVDAGPRGACDAEDAHADICPEVLCDGPSSWHWNGERCFEIDCGACRGTECERATFSRTECETAHATCEPVLCRGTGGTWLWWAELCGHYECGQEPPEICEVGAPGCDCGSGHVFVPGIGCELDPGCPEVDPLPADLLCTSTGGTWDALCCHSECGIPCALACASPACNCGPMQVFHPERGCEVGQRCMEPLVGEACDGGSRCQDATICCDTCGGAGCAGTPTCRVPVCDDEPAIDTCGNDSRAP